MAQSVCIGWLRVHVLGLYPVTFVSFFLVSCLQRIEKTNLKNLHLAEKVNFVTLDLSFISVTQVLDNVYQLMTNDAEIIILIKPQFELSPHEIGKGGLVKDPILHQKAVKRVVDYLESLKFRVIGVIDSPILGSTGNKEFLCYAIR
jgi:23S rRNA (cytidine1920-2'-O)/16S rRNA (cytidine1409-2'-O)-methyltransferase